MCVQWEVVASLSFNLPIRCFHLRISGKEALECKQTCGGLYKQICIITSSYREYFNCFENIQFLCT